MNQNRRNKFIRAVSCLLLALTIAVPLTAHTASAASYAEIPVYVDGTPILSGQAKLVDSITYVPFRAFCDAFGNTTVTWNQSTRTATARVWVAEMGH